MSLIGRLLGKQRNRWAEAWQSYPGSVAGAPALWSVDLGAIEAAPVSGLPVRIDVQVPYPAGPDGLPTGQLVEAEDAIRAAVDEVGGAYVGLVASRGQARFTAHAPAGADGQITLPQGQVHTEYDPHWAYVRDTLAPDAHQHRLLADRAMVVALSEQGDQLSTPRDVVHMAFFGAEEAAQAAAAALSAEGFATSVEHDDEGEFSLTALRRDPVAPPAVHDLTAHIQEVVERHEGMYEGWNCPLAA